MKLIHTHFSFIILYSQYKDKRFWWLDPLPGPGKFICHFILVCNFLILIVYCIAAKKAKNRRGKKSQPQQTQITGFGATISSRRIRSRSKGKGGKKDDVITIDSDSSDEGDDFENEVSFKLCITSLLCT